MHDIAEKILSEYIHEMRRNGDIPEQSLICKELYSRFYHHLKALGLSFVMEKEDLGIDYQPSRTQVQITPVKTAYPTKEKFDISLLDPQQKNLAPETGDYQKYWEQPVQVAIKVQVCPPDKDPARFVRSLGSDLRAFEKYAEAAQAAEGFSGLSLLFIQGEQEELLDGLDSLKVGIQRLQAGQHQFRVITVLNSYSPA